MALQVTGQAESREAGKACQVGAELLDQDIRCRPRDYIDDGDAQTTQRLQCGIQGKGEQGPGAPAGAAGAVVERGGGVAAQAEEQAAGTASGAAGAVVERGIGVIAGINPASLKTWDALRDAARKLTVVKDGRTETWGLGIPLAPIKTDSTPALIGMLDQPANIYVGCKANYANETGAKALAHTASLLTDAKVTPMEALVNNVDDVTHQFIAGRYAMAITSNPRYSVITSNAKFGADNIGIISWPSWSGQKPGAMPVSG